MAFNNRMMTDSEIIDSLGGATAVAKLLGFDLKKGPQRVHNWRERGIPSAIKVNHADIFLKKKFIAAEKKAA